MPQEPNNRNGAIKDCHVSGQNSEGVEFRGALLKLSRLAVVFELYNAAAVLRFSESLQEFKIVFNNRELYSGKAVVRNLMNTGPAVVVCEVTLNENSWSPTEAGVGGGPGDYQTFLTEWQRQYRILPEFKLVMADLQSFLRDLQLWLNSLELGLATSFPGARVEHERRTIDELAGPITRSIDVFVDRFETLVKDLDEETTVIHQAYLRRMLHPYLLCSPFAHRAYFKPLGYAGDYEMVGMMLRSPYEGGSLFARIMNFWLLSQYPATAHRNRIDYLVRKLVQFTLQSAAIQRRPRMLSIGCGPAQEVQRFLTDHAVSSQTDITLLDFNEETLRYTGAALMELKTRHNRATALHYIKKSVHHLLKEGGRNAAPLEGPRYDYIYCAGLFDYLSNQVCKRLMNTFYEMLEPGGLLIATNVSDTMNATRPFRYSMEYMLDWHLIYRDTRAMTELTPEAAPADSVTIVTEHVGVNVFIEVRKPDHA